MIEKLEDWKLTETNEDESLKRSKERFEHIVSQNHMKAYEAWKKSRSGIVTN